MLFETIVLKADPGHRGVRQLADLSVDTTVRFAEVIVDKVTVTYSRPTGPPKKLIPRAFYVVDPGLPSTGDGIEEARVRGDGSWANGIKEGSVPVSLVAEAGGLLVFEDVTR